jgi:signal transduction histidine kinase
MNAYFAHKHLKAEVDMRSFAPKNITTNWRTIAAYFSLFIVLFVAGIMVVASSKEIENRYGEFAYNSTHKLMLLLNSDQNNEFIHSKTIDQVFHPISLGPTQGQELEDRIRTNTANFESYGRLIESPKEKLTFNEVTVAWNNYILSREKFFSLKGNEDSALNYYRSIHKKAYDHLQNSVQALSNDLSNVITEERTEITAFVNRSHLRINIFIVTGMVLLVILGVLVFRGVNDLYRRNRELQHLQGQLVENEIEKQKEISRVTLIAQERERHELGKELHDNVNQLLSTAKLHLDSSLYNTNGQREQLIMRGRDLVNMGIEELRKLSRSLAPPSLGDLTLQESIEELVNDFKLVNDAKIGLAIRKLDEDRLSDGLKTSIYRIIQEQLNNIRKYAAASEINIVLEHYDDHVTLKIQDNGRGFDVKAKRKGMGITNIINRAQIYNGTVLLDAAPQMGCMLQIRFSLVPVKLEKMV